MAAPNPDIESDPTDLSEIFSLIQIFERQGHTRSGFPLIRPQDCERLIVALQGSANSNKPLFRTMDPVLTQSFANVVEQLRATELRAYPGEMLKLLLMVAQIRLQQNDHAAVREAIGHYADRPYAMEGDFLTMLGILWCDCQARSLAGDVKGLADLALTRMIFLVGLRSDHVFYIVRKFAAFLALGADRPIKDGYLESWLIWYCRTMTFAQRKRGSTFNRRVMKSYSRVFEALAAGTLYLRKFGDLRWGTSRMRNEAPLVTRAMGGIGDLIMMSPGFRVLSQQTGKPVRVAIPKRFFPLFQNNPSVQLIDVDGPPIDLSDESRWYNLSRCPAAAYEARHLPHVKKGRVELFASGMRIKARDLDASGQKPDIHLDAEQDAFRESFLQQHGLGGRPIIGVQPYSRELYRDYPRMPELIKILATKYDVLVFHHVQPELPPDATVATTAGLSLRESLSLLPAVDVMVTIDSGFMHAAAALEVPVVALFGPIDGLIRTVHVPKVALMQETTDFPCAPCWRNEDEPCTISGQTGISPCMAAIPLQKIVDATDRFVAELPRK